MAYVADFTTKSSATRVASLAFAATDFPDHAVDDYLVLGITTEADGTALTFAVSGWTQIGSTVGSSTTPTVYDGIRFITLRSTARYDMAEQMDIEILQGDSFDWEITVEDINGDLLDLTNFNVRGMGRKQYSDTLPTWTFVCTKDPDQVANTGLVRVTLTAVVTAAITKGTYKYDIEVYTAGGMVKKIYRGNAVVAPEATK
jgi:hypothetical protein